MWASVLGNAPGQAHWSQRTGLRKWCTLAREGNFYRLKARDDVSAIGFVPKHGQELNTWGFEWQAALQEGIRTVAKNVEWGSCFHSFVLEFFSFSVFLEGRQMGFPSLCRGKQGFQPNK